jgi:hypothetical protein
MEAVRTRSAHPEMTFSNEQTDFLTVCDGVQTHNIPERSPKITDVLRVLTIVGFGSDLLLRYIPPKNPRIPVS